VAVQGTPPALYTPAQLSPEDNEAYQKALSDIPIYRQGGIQIHLQDEKGDPLTGYPVQYRQVSHDFLFGGISNIFDTASVMQAGLNSWSVQMSWYWLQPEYGKYNLDFANYWLGIDELKSGNIKVRAQGFFDFAEGEFPPFHQIVPYDEFLGRLYEYESTVVKRFAPAVDNWEAILEPNFGNHNPLNLTRDEYYQAIATSIRAIRDNDPTATVEINLSYPCGGIDWQNNFQFVQEMLDRDIDFDSLGLQFYYNAYMDGGTFQMTRMPLSEMSACYDKYEAMLAPYGKKIVGSEFSVPSEAPAGKPGYWNTAWSEDTQAQYLETAYTIFFSKPSNLGLVWWNTVEPSPFVFNGGLVMEDGTPKKSYHTLQRLIQGWTTSGEGMTDTSGTVTFRGFGGDYEIEIEDPANGARMTARVHVTEQNDTGETVVFLPNNLLLQKKTRLEKLAAYWESRSKPDLAQKGRDYLALVDHHIQNAEWALTGQTIEAALDDLAIQTEVNLPVNKLIPVGYQDGFVMEKGSALMWGSTTLYFPYEFSAGTVKVEIKAHSQNEKGESPLMVSGVGMNYSQVWKVEDAQSETYSYMVPTTGREQVLTIRFPYDGRIYERINALNGDVGELKLYIDQIKLIIRSTEVQ